MRNLIIDWIHKLAELPQGEEIYLPVETKQAQKSLVSQFTKEITVYRNIDPIVGSQLSVAPTFKDGKLWVCLKRLATSPAIGFHKSVDGVVSRVTLAASTSERTRRLYLMAQDGLTADEAEAIEGALTPEERSVFSNVNF